MALAVSQDCLLYTSMGKNTVAACIHQDQTLVDGQAVKLRLLEPMQAGNIFVPKLSLIHIYRAGYGREL